MTLNEYQKKAKATAIFKADPIVYTGIGILDELCEVLEKKEENDIEGLGKEIGDVMWYISQASCALDLELQSIADKLIIPPAGCNIINYTMIVAGKYLGRVKKHLRDNVFDKELATTHLCIIYGGLLLICAKNGIELEAVLDENIKKLNSRKKRGKLKGNGDDR